VSLTKLNLGKFIRNDVKVLYVIHHIASGEYGSCCLCVTASGTACCAVKFFHRLNDVDLANEAQAELENWKTVYEDETGFTCRTWECAGSKCLVMPYLKAVKADQRHQLLEDGTISDALRKFAVSGHTHSDIKWRHFGWFGKKLFLCDLGAIKSSNEAEISDWHEASIALLRQSAGTKKQPATPKNRPTEQRQSTQQKRPDGSGTKRKRTRSEHRGQPS
jgi:hypothetical protein